MVFTAFHPFDDAIIAPFSEIKLKKHKNQT